MPEKEQRSDLDTLNKINTAQASVHHAVKAAAKAGSGNIAGAVAEIVADENFRMMILGIVCLFSLLIIGIPMLIGTAITGSVQAIYSGYMENAMDYAQEAGVASNGSILYFYGKGLEDASQKALLDTVSGLLFPKSNVADNSTLSDSNLTAIENDDYRNTLNAITDQEALTGENGALRKRIDMIKGRVSQRGSQFKTMAIAQYEWEAAGIALGTVLAETFNNPFLFAGVDIEKCRIDINTDIFELTDLQALKILAAYSIQKDCLLGDVDMWDLMHYCGWYGLDYEQITPFYGDSIYNCNYTKVFGQGIDGVVESGEFLNTEVHELSAPYMPVWIGNCAPQWYYEEIAQLNEANAAYERQSAGINPEAAEELPHYELTSDGKLDTSKFAKLQATQTYGIVDRLYTATNATLTINHSEYFGPDKVSREFINSLTGPLRAMWDDSVGARSKYTTAGNLVRRTEDGEHTVTLYPENSSHEYYIVNNTTGWKSDRMTVNSDGYIYIDDLRGNCNYTVYEVSLQKESNTNKPKPSIPGVDIMVEPTKPQISVTEKITQIDNFNTYSNIEQKEAYQLIFDLNVSFAARSVDQIIFDLLGLWPGSFDATVTGSDGREYAIGHKDEENMALTWTDIYTDSNGNTSTVAFERQTPYQSQAYEDIIIAIGDLLEIDTSGLFEPEYRYGESIAEMAMKEYEYYTANNLSGGSRYWDMVREAKGWSLPYDTPYCACFVFTTAWQCGFVGEGKAFGNEWTFYCPTLWEYLVAAGATIHNNSRDGYKPVPGDIIFYGSQMDHNYSAHVGIVYEVRDDGTLVTVEGNWNGHRVCVNEYSDYNVGAFVYYSPTAAANIYIQGYITPQYPSDTIANPLYQTVFSQVKPTEYAQHLGESNQSVFIAGITRFRWSQLPEVMNELQENYPELYSDAMRTAYEAGDETQFLEAWNVVAERDPDWFRVVQRGIASRLFYEPLAEEVKTRTGFDWMKTNARQELLLALVTTSDQYDLITDILVTACSGMSDSITDADLVREMFLRKTLANLISGNQKSLWPSDSQSLRNGWMQSIDAVVAELYKVQTSTPAQQGVR